MNFGRALIIMGLILAGAGLLITFGARLGFKVGRLPGDIVWRGKNGTFYFPLITCVLLSAIGSLVLWLVNRK